MPAQRIIKKYPNRRLYDTEISTYVTLEDIRQLVVDGESFEVHDARTGADLTRSVLLQIIAESEEQGVPILSTKTLSQLIRYYGDSLQGFMGNYIERSLQVFAEQQNQFRTQLNSLLGQTPWSVMQGVTERNMDLLKNMGQSLFSAASAARAAAAQPQSQPRGPTPSEPPPAADATVAKPTRRKR